MFPRLQAVRDSGRGDLDPFRHAHIRFPLRHCRPILGVKRSKKTFGIIVPSDHNKTAAETDCNAGLLVLARRIRDLDASPKHAAIRKSIAHGLLPRKRSWWWLPRGGRRRPNRRLRPADHITTE
jgi:hypothetical protein